MAINGLTSSWLNFLFLHFHQLYDTSSQELSAGKIYTDTIRRTILEYQIEIQNYIFLGIQFLNNYPTMALHHKSEGVNQSKLEYQIRIEIIFVKNLVFRHLVLKNHPTMSLHHKNEGVNYSNLEHQITIKIRFC